MPGPSECPPGEPVLRVERPGLLTTIQDLGRPGHLTAGIPAGGAMDRFAMTAANLLVGNQPGDAGLEVTIQGPALTALRGSLVAIAGADLSAERNGRPIPGWTSCFLAAGDRLSFGARRRGARAYVAIQGGLEADRWLGSRSTFLLVSRGGLGGRQLEAGDELRRRGPAPGPAVVGRTLAPGRRPLYPRVAELRCVPGPHAAALTPADRESLYGPTWNVSRDADRMGVRLEGGRLSLEVPDLVSFGLAPGCIQVPPSGEPIVLLQDHQTAGGYPVVAGVATADLPLAARLLPGDRVRFAEISLDAAHRALLAQQQMLDSLR
ncbi:MAG: biotin-dependent carboxyltransferase family protein [Candidatus Dormibacteraceae bacterium]